MALLLIGEPQNVYAVADLLISTKDVDCLLWADDHGPECLAEYPLLSYECIVVIFRERDIVNGFIEILISEYGIAPGHIIDFYRMYEASVPLMICERRMTYPQIQQYQGMILGISHAEMGIISRLLKYPFCNMAVGSQDLFYNMKVLEYCIKNYPQKISNMEYLILDLFDYTYFNYDTSLSKNILAYYLWGGYHLDPHHFNQNHHFSFSYEEAIRKIATYQFQNISERVIDYWEKYFGNIHRHNAYGNFINHREISNRLKIYTPNLNDDNLLLNRSIQKNAFPSTIAENKTYFEALLKYAYEINPNIKIYAMLLPRYIDVYEKLRIPMNDWKQLFYNIIADMQKKYPFTFLDLSEHEISRKKVCYQDNSHLNYYGAVQFTNWINENILK